MPFRDRHTLHHYIYIITIHIVIITTIITQVNGKLHVSLTKVYDGQNMLVNQFSSKQEVIEVLIIVIIVVVKIVKNYRQ